MNMNTLKATEGNWLFNGEGFAREVSGFGDLSKWEEVSNDFKNQWEEEHKDNEEINGGVITDAPKDDSFYARRNGEWQQTVDGRPFELIEEIVTEEEIISMQRTEEPDGTPYNFEAIRVYIFNGENSNFGSVVRSWVNFDNVNTKDLSVVLLANNTGTCMFTVSCKNGFWDAQAFANNYNGISYNAGQNTNEFTKKDNSKITKLAHKSSNTNPFKVGTIFRIYAIR